MSKQPIAFSNSIVPPEKTAIEIEEMLRKANASKVGKEYREGKVQAIYFQVDTDTGTMPFMLPVRVEPVFDLLVKHY